MVRNVAFVKGIRKLSNIITRDGCALMKLNAIKDRIDNAVKEANRPLCSVKLVGASKQQSAASIQKFYEAGLESIGENYLQEALKKQQELAHTKLEWHFIGRIQSNKTKLLSKHFNWIHGVDRYTLAQRLSRHRGDKPPINILIQLNVDNETTKAGVNLGDAPSLCAAVNELENIKLRGFMLIPVAREGFDAQRRPYAKARIVMEKINQKYDLNLDNLSMGMSNDLEAAVAEGATMVRIGTDLFGNRS